MLPYWLADLDDQCDSGFLSAELLSDRRVYRESEQSIAGDRGFPILALRIEGTTLGTSGQSRPFAIYTYGALPEL